MSGQKLTLEDVLKEVESTELKQEFSDDATETAWRVEKMDLTDTDIVRIEENVPFYWKGVTGCNTNERAQPEYRKTRDEWVKKKMFEHSNWQWTRYGMISATGRCSSSIDYWTSVRKCSCSGTLKCFIEFSKP